MMNFVLINVILFFFVSAVGMQDDGAARLGIASRLGVASGGAWAGGARSLEVDQAEQARKREAPELDTADQQDNGETKKQKVSAEDDGDWFLQTHINPKTSLQVALEMHEFGEVFDIINQHPELASCDITDHNAGTFICKRRNLAAYDTINQIDDSIGQYIPNNYPFLIYLIKKGYKDLLHKILTIRGVQINTLFSDALNTNDIAVIDYVWNHIRTSTAYYKPELFVRAVVDYRRNAILFLLNSNVEIPLRIEVGDYSTTPLHVATEHGDQKLVGLLCKKFPHLHNTQNSLNDLPLHLAIINNYATIADYLLNLHRPSDLLATDIHGYSLLHIAAVRRNLKIFIYLWEKVPQLRNLQTGDGFTALGLIAKKVLRTGYVDSLIWLLQNAKLDWTITPDANGRTIFDYLPIHLLLEKMIGATNTKMCDDINALIVALLRAGAPITKDTIMTARALDERSNRLPKASIVGYLLEESAQYHMQHYNRAIGHNLGSMQGNGPLISEILTIVGQYLGVEDPLRQGRHLFKPVTMEIEDPNFSQPAAALPHKDDINNLLYDIAQLKKFVDQDAQRFEQMRVSSYQETSISPQDFKISTSLNNIFKKIKRGIKNHSINDTKQFQEYYEILQKLITYGIIHLTDALNIIHILVANASEVDKAWYEQHPKDIHFKPFTPAMLQWLKEYEIQRRQIVYQKAEKVRASIANAAAWAANEQVSAQPESPLLTPKTLLSGLAAALYVSGSKLKPL